MPINMWSQKQLRQCLVITLFTMTVSSSLAASLAVDTTISEPIDSQTQDILMKGAKPMERDAYLCTAYPIADQEAYIYKFKVTAQASTAHHILMYGCDKGPYSTEPIWACEKLCDGKSSILFGWAKNAPPAILPKGVGFRIGKQTHIKSIVLQVHYGRSFAENEPADHSGIRIYTTHEKQPFVAGIFLLGHGSFNIPPGNPSYKVDVSCKFEGQKSIFPFAYRTHAHTLGSVITGYQYNGSYHEIGKGNPQWPQAFYQVKNHVEVKPGDILAMRCTYDSTKSDHSVGIGPTGYDEMCNFYIMFYTDSSVENPFGQCWGNKFKELTGDNFPPDASVLLPPNPGLEEKAKGHHRHGGMKSSDIPAGEAPGRHNFAEGNTGKQNVAYQIKKDNFEDSAQVQGKHKHSVVYGHQEHTEKNILDTKPDNKEHTRKNKLDLKPDILGDSREMLQYDYDFDDLDPRGRYYDKRQQHEYYGNYDANDMREKGQLEPSQGGAAEEVLSRNRNREFEAMNQQLKHFPRKNPPPLKPTSQKISNPSISGDDNSEPRRPLLMDQGIPAGDQSQSSMDATAEEKIHSKIHFDQKLVNNASWLVDKLGLGEIGGVATDKDGNVYIFHRGSRQWMLRSFSYDNDFMSQNSPIEEDVVVILDSQGRLVRKFGAGQYFMPHGIEVDKAGNIWLTDVALHQVFKILPGQSQPSLILGQRFKHGTDTSSFCQPTDVAVLSSGEFFVSDGYCNGRVLKFAQNGTVVDVWGERNAISDNPPAGTFDVPHSIALSEENNLVCVADRENGRIQCFDLDGNVKHIIKHELFGPRLFAIAHSSDKGGVLYAVNGPSNTDVTVQGFTLDIKTGHLLERWNVPQQLKNPHDLCVHSESRSVYVGEIEPPTVWKLSRAPDVSTSGETPYTTPKHDHPMTETKVNGSTTAPTGNTSGKVSVTVGSNDTSVAVSQVKDIASSDLSPSLIIGCLLVVPVILLLVITLVVRARKTGSLKCWGQSKKRVFSLQGILGNSHKGFDPLSTEDSDHDLDQEDSDREEYLAPKKIKGKA